MKIDFKKSWFQLTFWAKNVLKLKDFVLAIQWIAIIIGAFHDHSSLKERDYHKHRADSLQHTTDSCYHLFKREQQLNSTP